MSKPVVFLDFDGVLCTVRSHYAYAEAGLMQHLDPIAVKLVERLCRKAGAEIVISSTWRQHHNEISMMAILMNAGMSKPPFHDDWSTPRRLSSGARGYEIKEWLDRHPLTPSYVILDDDSDMLDEQTKHFVQTDSNDGFLWKDYEKACKILGCEE